MKVIVYNIFGLGHINPTLKLVSSLVRDGSHVIYHSSPERQSLIESSGAEFRNYGSDEYKAADYNPGKNFVLQTLPATLGLLPYLRDEIEREKPDLILYDSMAPWGKVLSQLYQIPSKCLVTTMVLSRNAKQKMFKQNAVEIDELNINAIKKLSKLGARIEFEDVLGAYGKDNLVFSDRSLSQDLEELNPGFFHFIEQPEETNTDFDFQFLNTKNKRKIIAMALGTILPKENPEIFQWYNYATQAFSSDERFLLILATGTEDIKERLGPLASNTFAFTHFPQQEILKHADAIIHHGGMNSTSEALRARVPMLVIPYSADQFTNAEKVEAMGMGLCLHHQTLSAEKLKSSVLSLLFSPNCPT